MGVAMYAALISRWLQVTSGCKDGHLYRPAVFASLASDRQASAAAFIALGLLYTCMCLARSISQKMPTVCVVSGWAEANGLSFFRSREA